MFSLDGMTLGQFVKQDAHRRGAHWKVINGFLILLFLGSGFLPGKPEEFDTARVGVTAFAVAIVLIPVTTVIWFYFTNAELRTAAWDRCPFGSRDPLQTLFICSWCALAAFVSALCQIPRFGTQYGWTAMGYGGIFLGILIGRIVIYRIFADRITTAD